MDNPNDIPVLAVAASATMLTAKAFASELLDACNSHEHLVLDVDAVTQADLSFVQIIHAARMHMREKNGSLTLAHPVGEALAALLNAAGFSSDSSDADFWFKGANTQ